MFKYNDNITSYHLRLKAILIHGRYPLCQCCLLVNSKMVKLRMLVSYQKQLLMCHSKLKYALGQEQDPYNAIILTDSSLEVSQDFMAPNDIIDPFIEQLTDILVLVNIDLVTSAKVFYIVG